MIIQKYFLKLLVCLMLIAAIDGIALGLLQAEGDGPAENIAENIAWVIWDILALVAQVCSLVFQCVLWFFDAGDPVGCMWNIIKSAGSLIYHLVALITEVLFSPINLASKAAVAIFTSLGWSTSEHTWEACWDEPVLDDDGNPIYLDQDGDMLTTRECEIYTEKYVALQDIPVLGYGLGLITDALDTLKNIVKNVIGDPSTHSGGLYAIVGFDVRVPNPAPGYDEIVTGMPSSLKNLIYDVIDPIIEKITGAFYYLVNKWRGLLEVNIVGGGFLKEIIYDAIHWIFDFLPQPADTRNIFWGTFGLSVPDLLEHIGGTDPITEPPTYTPIKPDEGLDER